MVIPLFRIRIFSIQDPDIGSRSQKSTGYPGVKKALGIQESKNTGSWIPDPDSTLKPGGILWFYLVYPRFPRDAQFHILDIFGKSLHFHAKPRFISLFLNSVVNPGDHQTKGGKSGQHQTIQNEKICENMKPQAFAIGFIALYLVVFQIAWLS
jgi:hypothetical protein